VNVLSKADNEAIVLRSPREIERMREAGKIVALTLQELRNAIKPGVTTKELDDLAGRIFRENGAVSAR